MIDPKGSAYRAVAERRRSLKKTVRCLDPMNLCGGVDLWNPLTGIVPTDTAYLQRVARTLLPSAISEENAYFQNKAVDVIVGAFLGAHFLGHATPLAVSNLLANPERLAESLKNVTGTVANRVREFLAMDAKTRDPILSTAQQAFQWCDDERLQHLTSASTFSLADLCRGRWAIVANSLPPPANCRGMGRRYGPFGRPVHRCLFTVRTTKQHCCAHRNSSRFRIQP